MRNVRRCPPGGRLRNPKQVLYIVRYGQHIPYRCSVYIPCSGGKFYHAAEGYLNYGSGKSVVPAWWEKLARFRSARQFADSFRGDAEINLHFGAVQGGQMQGAATQAMRDIVEERQRRRCLSYTVIRIMTGFYNAFYYTGYLNYSNG